MKTITGYKWVTDDLKSSNGYIQWVVGEWQKHEGPLELCKSGFHACRTALQSLDYRYGPRFFTVEAGGELWDDDGKFVCSEMRLVRELPTDKIVLDFMIAVLKNCLFRYERVYPDDMRPRNVLDALEAYRQDPCDYTKWLIGAAGDAAWAAAGDAAWAAAWAAERKWQEKTLEEIIRRWS